MNEFLLMNVIFLLNNQSFSGLERPRKDPLSSLTINSFSLKVCVGGAHFIFT